MADTVSFDSLLNTASGMTAIVNNTKHDDDTISVTGVDWFTYVGKTASTIYVSGNNWIGFGQNAQQLKICNRDGAVYYIYRQEGVLESGKKFLKIRVEGYSHYSTSYQSSTGLKYEIFLIEGQTLFVNVIKVPSNSNYIGTSSIADGSTTTSLTISATSTVPVYILVKDAGSAQKVTYEKYSDISVTEISVTTLPAKMTYYQKELFNSTGMVVTANLSDGSTVETTDYKLTGFDSSTAGAKTITVTVEGFTATFEVTVLEASLTGIFITTLPDKIEYHINGKFTPDGIIVSASTSDGNTVTLESSKLEYSGFDSSSPKANTIAVNYNGLSTEFTVTIIAPVSISCDGVYNTDYFIGDKSNVSIYSVSATYSDGITDKNIKTGYTIAQVDTSTEGQKTAIVNYFGATFEIPVTVLGSFTVQIGTPNAEDVVFSFDILTGIASITGNGEFSRIQSVFNVPSTINNRVKELNIGEGITKIPNMMFPGVSIYAMEEINFPSTLTEIGSSNFCDTKISELLFPQSLAQIGDYCFKNNSIIIQLDIPASVKGIGSGSFSNLSKLEEITFHDGLETISPMAFNDCPLIKNLVLPSTLKSMPYSFQASTLDNLEIGGNDVYLVPGKIGNISAKNIIIRSGTTIGDVFSCKENIEVLTLNSNVKWDDSTAQFNSCSNLTNLTIGDGITSIPASCFVYCSSFDNVIIPDSVAEIGQSAFEGCSSLKNLTLSKNIQQIPPLCFRNCGFEAFTISDDSKIESIGNMAFQNCSALKEVYIGKNVKTIGPSAFINTDSTTIRINQTLNAISGSPWSATDATVEWLIKATKIEILSQPTKLKYKKDEVFDSSGLTVKATYGDGTSKEISDYTLSSPDMSSIGNKAVTITYDGQTTTFDILVIDISKIEVATMPSKTEYLVNSSLDTTGLAISTVYTDGSKETITGYSLSELDSSEPGEKTITVTYLTFTTTFNVTVVAYTAGIRITHYPDKVYYAIGENLDTTGLTVAKYREDGTEVEITDYTLSGFDSSKAGSKAVTVMYTDMSGTDVEVYSTDFQVRITKDGQNPFDSGEQINVTVHWIDGEFEDLTNEHIQNNTLTLQESICSESYFIFGGCVSNQITFQAHHEQFDGTDEESYPSGRIEVYLECKGTEIKIFTGEIASADRQANSLTRNFVAYDYLYKLRNTDIVWWYKNQTKDKSAILTQKQFRDLLFEYLGIEQVETTLHWDKTYVPNTNYSSEMNVANVLKDLCLQNDRFGWMNRDGKFEYLKLRQNSEKHGETTSGKKLYRYYNNEEVHLDTFKSFQATEGRIWFPNIIFTDPDPNRAFGFTQGDYTAQEAYENNVYYNRNSFFVGNEDWLNYVWDADEYGGISRVKPIMKICYGTFVNQDLRKYYRAQGYTAEVAGNPFNTVGQGVKLYHSKQIQHDNKEPVELQWYVHSYIMSRTLKVGITGMIDTYSANNAPFNSNSQQLGKYTPEISGTVNVTRSEMPTISYAEFSDGSDSEFTPQAIDDFTDGSDSTEVKKAQLRCMKRIKKSDYDALVAAGTDRKDTLYFTFEE